MTIFTGAGFLWDNLTQKFMDGTELAHADSS